MITRENVLAYELIGQPVIILDSKDPSIKNMHGKIVYETKNLLVINKDQSIVKVPKNVVTISLRLADDTDCVIKGSDLIGRPEDRIQRLS
jgi:ribonuclease P protein subunit POP4